MFFTPEQAVIVLDTLQKPAGQGTVLVMNTDTQVYDVSFRYPDQPEAQIIPVPGCRLLTDNSHSSRNHLPA